MAFTRNFTKLIPARLYSQPNNLYLCPQFCPPVYLCTNYKDPRVQHLHSVKSLVKLIGWMQALIIAHGQVASSGNSSELKAYQSGSGKHGINVLSDAGSLAKLNNWSSYRQQVKQELTYLQNNLLNYRQQIKRYLNQDLPLTALAIGNIYSTAGVLQLTNRVLRQKVQIQIAGKYKYMGLNVANDVLNGLKRGLGQKGAKWTLEGGADLTVASCPAEDNAEGLGGKERQQTQQLLRLLESHIGTLSKDTPQYASPYPYQYTVFEYADNKPSYKNTCYGNQLTDALCNRRLFPIYKLTQNVRDGIDMGLKWTDGVLSGGQKSEEEISRAYVLERIRQ